MPATLFLLWQVLRRQRIVGAFVVPDVGSDPPALAVIKQLYAVNAAGDDRAPGFLTAFIGAKDVRDVSELLGDAVNLALVEAVFHQRRVSDGLGHAQSVGIA